MEGVYVCDSRNNSIAAEHISFRELASRGASPMDMMAVTFCEENGIPGPKIYTLSIFSPIGLVNCLSPRLVSTFLQLAFSIFTSLEIYRGHCVEKGSVH